MYKRLACVSRAAAGITAREACDIIRVSVNRNGQQQLSGGLVLIDRHFVQVLEGHPDRVDARFAVIAADPRHEAVQLRESVVCDALLFQRRWMAFSNDAVIPPALRAQFGIDAEHPVHALPAEAPVRFVLACGQQAPAR